MLAMPSGGDNNEVTGTAAAMAQCQQPVSIAAPAAAALQQQLQVQQIVIPDHLADAEVSQLTSSLGMEDAFMESAQPRSTATLAVNVAADSAFQTPRSGSGRMVRTASFESSGVQLNSLRSSSRPPSCQNGNLKSQRFH